ncbi:MAG: helix-hairpin-helix domain-containing protein [Armatimonadota bacterium]|nr:helix-hairpin-helix domain-containing protein [bacterium]
MRGLDFTRNQKLALLAIVGVAVIGLSAAHLRNSLSLPGDVLFTEPNQGSSTKIVTTGSDSTDSGAASNAGNVVFQVAGCVKTPGVYSLPSGSRVYEAIKAAGGAASGADTQSMNLAAKIEDASKIYVPRVGESAQASTATMPVSSMAVNTTSTLQTTAKGSASGAAKLSQPGDGVVHINSASVEDLQRLPGVGPSTAQKIVDFRARVGRFTSPEQLNDVSGIGPKKWEKMRAFVAL